MAAMMRSRADEFSPSTANRHLPNSAKSAKTAAVHERICSPSGCPHRPDRNLGIHRYRQSQCCRRVLGEIQEAIRALVPFPQLGHVRPDLTSRPLRFQLVRDLLIAYAPDEKPLLAVALLHPPRNPRTIPALLRTRARTMELSAHQSPTRINTLSPHRP